MVYDNAIEPMGVCMVNFRLYRRHNWLFITRGMKKNGKGYSGL
jgi:hypothetical protein